jgi:hypothetical protein
VKVYIAGKITGDPDYWDKFQRAAIQLRRDGHLVISPTCLPDGLAWVDYMHVCYALIDIADAVYFLADWQDSRGATDEHRYAHHVGKLVWYEAAKAAKAVTA